MDLVSDDVVDCLEDRCNILVPETDNRKVGNNAFGIVQKSAAMQNI